MGIEPHNPELAQVVSAVALAQQVQQYRADLQETRAWLTKALHSPLLGSSTKLAIVADIQANGVIPTRVWDASLHDSALSRYITDVDDAIIETLTTTVSKALRNLRPRSALGRLIARGSKSSERDDLLYVQQVAAWLNRGARARLEWLADAVSFAYEDVQPSSPLRDDLAQQLRTQVGIERVFKGAAQSPSGGQSVLTASPPAARSQVSMPPPQTSSSIPLPPPTQAAGDLRVKLPPAGAIRALVATLQTSDESHLADVKQIASAAAQDEVQRTLHTEPLETLQEYGQGQRLKSLADAGFRTAASVLNAPVSALERVPGVGPQTAQASKRAAQAWAEAARSKVRPKLSPRLDDVPSMKIVAALHAVRKARTLQAVAGTERLQALPVAWLDTLAAAAESDSHTEVFTATPHDPAVAAMREVFDVLERRPELVLTDESPAGLMADYHKATADYQSMFAATLGLGAAHHGDVPQEMQAAANKHELDLRGFNATLRPYQSFGAQYAVMQRKIILGDEMGLGKTIQALAVSHHLANSGLKRTLVVCPASVIENWAREVRERRNIEPHVAHGPQRDAVLRRWQLDGGVAVTTYQTLGALDENITQTAHLLVADEAHYVKNPDAQRTQRVLQLAQQCDHVLYMSGTPLENRVDEFVGLIGHVNPLVAARAANKHQSPGGFRKSIAPAYLRRNAAEVLTELPDRIDNVEMLTLSSAERKAYLNTDKHIMLLRQATYGVPERSTKADRILEIADEAESGGRRVVVFSYFHRVLDDLSRRLAHRVSGRLDGSVPPQQRQTILDAFGQSASGSVLLCQIDSAGIGLNIQAASVAILTEPQFKPSVEDQAIGRLHRMGQRDVVLVYRLLAAETIDQNLYALVNSKAGLFDDFARRSYVADTNFDAKRATDEQISAHLLNIERQRVA